MDKPREYCGVFGIFNAVNAAQQTYFGLHALQHRGQESAGIVTSTYDEHRKRAIMPLHRGFGKVLDVFADSTLFQSKLLGDSAIGHNRYSTAGASTNPANIQPFVAPYRDGNIAIAHNGNLSNVRELRSRFIQEGTLFFTGSDTEIILHLIARSRRSDQINQIIDALNQVEGAFSLALLTDDCLIAARDPNGFRPLALGVLNNGEGKVPSYCVASETCAFDIIGAEYVRDIEPGEILIIDRDGCKTGKFRQYHIEQRFGISQCIFEYIYFSRPDSKIFGEMTDKVRRKLGKQLAHEAPPPVDSKSKRTIVISVPDSSNTATLGYATECQKLGYDVRYEIGLIRNHYVGRTFIEPGQNAREMKVRCKFNTVKGVLKDRVVVLVDDSIVRGTTSKQLINMVRQAGAREVHMRITSPPVSHPCYYGMDFPSKEELLANKHGGNLTKMADWLGADSLIYLSPKGLMKAVQKANKSKLGYCNACFTSKYPVPHDVNVTKEEHEQLTSLPE